jgi:Fe-S oxidoreductase
MCDTMALCVGCKGCKRECPTGVDMAKMKLEFLYHWRKRHPLSLRERLIAYLPRYAPFVRRLAALANLRDRVPGLATLSERWLGFSARRALPKWRSDAFLPSATTPAGEGREVVLLVDTFNTYFEPENARAAQRVLEAAGYRVHLPALAGDRRPLCCGRTFLSAGLIDQARAEARRTIAALQPYLARGVPVVGLEPSCLLALRDELVSLLGGEAKPLAQHSVLFEEFLAREHKAGALKLDLRPLREKLALLHGHCHQKAFGLVGDVAAVLRLIPGLDVQVIESSCCGMAGAFGYEAEHYDVSMQMAELTLLPAVRDAPDNALIVADGTSCRHQIADGAERSALHVARVLERALA